MEERKVQGCAASNVGPHYNEFSVTMLGSRDYATPHGLEARNYSTIQEAEAAFFQAYPDGFWHDTRESFYKVVANRYLDRITEFIKQYKTRDEIVKNLRYQHMTLFNAIWSRGIDRPSEEFMTQRIEELRNMPVVSQNNVG